MLRFSAGLKIQRSDGKKQTKSPHLLDKGYLHPASLDFRLDVFGILRITNPAERYFRYAPLDLKSCGYFDN